MSNFNSEYLLVKSLSFNHFLANSFPSIVIGIHNMPLIIDICIHHIVFVKDICIHHQKLYMVIYTGCPILLGPLCFFFHFLGFWSTYRGTSDLYSTALEICYIIATRILKIDSEIAEIIEVKVGTCNTKCQFLNVGCQL